MASRSFFATPALKSHYDVLERNQQRYLQGVKNGSFVPFSYPMCSYGLGLLVLYFLVPPDSSLHSKASRYITFALTAAWHIYMIRNCRAFGASVGFGIGITSAWGVLWAAVTLIFNDAKRDWRRVKREEHVTSASHAPHTEKFSTDPDQVTIEGIRQRKFVEPPADRRLRKTVDDTADSSSGTLVAYRWESYPPFPMQDRLDWCLDAISNFRGVGWSWTVPGLPSRPPLVEASLAEHDNGSVSAQDRRVSRAGIVRFDTYWACIRHNAWLALKGYICMDILKTIMNHDPYFWGLVDRAPPTWLPYFVQRSALWTRSYRLLVTMGVTWTGLRSIYCIAPLFFAGVMGPKTLGANGEPWMYPDHFGSYFQVFNRGLAGWWGAWWHQVFRFGFQAGGEWVSGTVLGMDKNSKMTGVVQMFVAFGISGLLHASGSLTMMGETFPWSSSFAFFALQPVGILVERAWRRSLRELGLMVWIPRWLGLLGNFCYVHAWFLLTGPLLTDDFARGGVFLFEPVMLSPLRGLGFGVEGDGFFCWGGFPVAWHKDRRWWLTGLAL